jgi:zinc protease
MILEQQNHNGHKFNFVIEPQSELVVCHITYRLHTKNTAHDTVLRLLYTDLLLSGAGKLNRVQFIDAINLAGGSIATSSQADAIHIQFQTIEKNLPKVLSLVELLLEDPTFLESEIERAKRNLTQSLPLEAEQARKIAATLLSQNIYSNGHVLHQWHPRSLVSSIQKIRREDFVQFHQSIRSNLAIVTISGNERTKQKLYNRINHLLPDTQITAVKKTNLQILEHNGFVGEHIKSQQNIELAIGHHVALPVSTLDYWKLAFGIAVLGKWGGFSGRLMNTVRERDGLTYGIYARLEGATMETAGHFRIMTFFHPNDAMRGITVIREEINLLLEKGITQKEFVRFQQIIKTGHVLTFDSLTDVVEMVHANALIGLSLEQQQSYISMMTSDITKREVNEALQTYLQPHRLTFAAAGNLELIKNHSEQLASLIRS